MHGNINAKLMRWSGLPFHAEMLEKLQVWAWSLRLNLTVHGDPGTRQQPLIIIPWSLSSWRNVNLTGLNVSREGLAVSGLLPPQRS